MESPTPFSHLAETATHNHVTAASAEFPLISDLTDKYDVKIYYILQILIYLGKKQASSQTELKF